eukprot:TRINITY_DN4848_c0_g1_i2.p1 TRINITY_DN4848_c0_g1~~TRINITY_DN4848_c0_g1_i2.p1  ORF type:complete len:139 (+),score=19.14 TRINITY_DN4848_c0_g1_i2:117-533(+)
MEPSETRYEKAEYVETTTGNKIHKRVVLAGSRNIRLSGKVIVRSGVVIRGDLAGVSIGKLSILSENSVIRPPHKKFKGGIAFFPLTIGDFVEIGQNCIVEAVSIGNCVRIGDNCQIVRKFLLTSLSSLDLCYCREEDA